MQELIKAGKIYVAQPPLYQVTRRKKSEYVLNERRLRQIQTDMGLESTTLVIRDDDGKEAKRVGGEELRHVIELLGKMEEVIRVIQRRGIDFAEFLSKRDSAGRLPYYRVVVEGEEEFFLSAGERDDFLRKQNLLVEDEEMTKVQGEGEKVADKPAQENWKRLQKNQELHEVKELEKLFVQIEALGMAMDDYFLTQEESVSGEKLATKYALLNEERTVDIAGVGQILPEVLGFRKSEMEIKRFKGLGEMNSEELWQTTLDPNKRVLLRVTLEQASEAEQMFSVLMGEDVERRRQFIEEHALEVKNLDV
jgi:DNA gyrase subunit B